MKRALIFSILFLIVISLASGCIGQQPSQQSISTNQTGNISQVSYKDTTNNQSKYYDDLDSAINDANLIDQIG